MKETTFAHPVVAGGISRSFVPLVVDGTVPTPLVNELRVSAYPATFIISPQAVILARIDGYVDPATLAGRLNLGWPGVGVASAARAP
jgi:hypothetical protein